MSRQTITIRGARTHNLQNIDVEIPVGKMTVITGLSGSGKSSLAWDTMYAAGQRRYLESVSGQAHQMIRTLRRPDVDEVTGLPPTVSIDQRAALAPARSTVAITTDLYDYLRLLYARCGVVHCTTCRTPVSSQTIDEILQRVLAFPDRTKFLLLAPLVHHRKGGHRDVLDRIGRHGLVRVRIDGRLFDLSDVGDLDESRPHTIEAVVDRLILKDGIESRLLESLALAVRESGDACIVSVQNDGQSTDHYFNTRHSCANCETDFPEPDPGLFSFNSARGACSKCEGMGFEGFADDSDSTVVFRRRACAACGGTRLQNLAAGVRFGNQTLPELTALNVEDALRCVREWRSELGANDGGSPKGFFIRPDAQPAAVQLLPDLQKRLESLTKVGLSYLTLDRYSRSLSGGEYQRTRLAACLGSGIHGACYLLDEPTNGLHPQNTKQLLKNLQSLRDDGATVVVVEHDPLIVREADYLIEMGPAAGADGGRVLFAGLPDSIPKDTPTGKALLNERNEDRSVATQSADATAQLVVRDACLNNLQNVTVSIPLNRLVCVTGVSGSGKSSLVVGTLFPVVRANLSGKSHFPAAVADVECGNIEGLESLDRAVLIDGRSIARNRRSCIATHSGVWNDVRRLYSRTRAARAQGLVAGQFSFNSGTGRCSQCKGTGMQDVRMHLLPDAEVPCPACGGSRFSRAILDIRFGGRSVDDVLNLRVDEALDAFSEIESTVRRLKPFHQVGLGYMTLGQSASSWSGGESHRVHLATELQEKQETTSLYVLDEPTRGLHGQDVARLLHVLRSLVNQGNSVIVIEHNVQLIQATDWLIDMGPGPSAEGGRIIAEGAPADLRLNPDSVIAAWL